MVTCSEGQYSLYGSGVCTTCKAGTYCPSTTLGTHVLLYSFMFIWFCVRMCVRMCVYVYVFMCIFMCVCMYVCVCLCVYVCTYVWILVYLSYLICSTYSSSHISIYISYYSIVKLTLYGPYVCILCTIITKYRWTCRIHQTIFDHQFFYQVYSVIKSHFW